MTFTPPSRPLSLRLLSLRLLITRGHATPTTPFDTLAGKKFETETVYYSENNDMKSVLKEFKEHFDIVEDNAGSVSTVCIAHEKYAELTVTFYIEGPYILIIFSGLLREEEAKQSQELRKKISRKLEEIEQRAEHATVSELKNLLHQLDIQ